MLCAMSHWVEWFVVQVIVLNNEHVTPWLADSDSEPATYVGDNSINIILQGPLLSQAESV